MTRHKHHKASSPASVWLPVPTGDMNEDWAYLLGFLKSAFQNVFVTRYDRYADTLRPPDFHFDLLVQLLAIRNLDLVTCMEKIAIEQNAAMTNPASATRCSADKRNLPVLFPECVPETRIVRDIDTIESCFHDWGKDIVIKPAFFGKGEYVTRVNSYEALDIVPELLKHSPTSDLVVQPFCEGFSRGDQRILLTRNGAGESIILGNFGRIPKPGEWITNISQGGSFNFRRLEKDEQLLALDVFDRSGLDFAGLDIGRHDGRVLLIEINPTAGGLIDCDMNTQSNSQALLFDLLQSRLGSLQ